MCYHLMEKEFNSNRLLFSHLFLLLSTAAAASIFFPLISFINGWDYSDFDSLTIHIFCIYFVCVHLAEGEGKREKMTCCKNYSDIEEKKVLNQAIPIDGHKI